MTSTYELVVVFDPNIEPEQLETDLRKIHDLVINHGGKFRRWERWGKRRLTYEIRHRQYGTYVLTVYDLATTATHELDRLLHLTTSLLRFLVTKVEPERVPEVDEESVQSLGITKEVVAPAEVSETALEVEGAVEVTEVEAEAEQAAEEPSA